MNISLNYFGASGGFYALWHILLGTNYRCIWQGREPDTQQKEYARVAGENWPQKLADANADNVDPEWLNFVEDLQYPDKKIYKTHWNIKDKQEWKHTEVWPNNEVTTSTELTEKIFFYCMPTIENWQQHKKDYRIFLYTDLDLQLMLANNKRAWKGLKGNITPEKIQQTKDNSTWLNGTQVFGDIAQFTQADLYVKLQDIVKTQGGAILEPLGYTVTEENISHNAFWLDKHNEEEQRLLTI